jgi:hypothetical protein
MHTQLLCWIILTLSQKPIIHVLEQKKVSMKDTRKRKLTSFRIQNTCK